MKVNKVFWILGVCIGCMGCEGYLDTNPSNALKPGEEITTEGEVLAALRGAYDGLLDKRYYGADFVVYGDVKGDDVQTRVAGLRTEAAYRFSWRQADAPEGLWLVPYEVIRRVNFLLESLEKNGIPQTEVIRDARGQALALRALCHFNLLLTYGIPYLKDQGRSPGVPLVSRTLEAGAVPARSTVEAGYRMVEDDLRHAVADLGTEVKNGYFNRWAAEALLARVFLYRGAWDSAYVYAERVIGNGPYTLVPNDRYLSSWKEEFTAESVLQLSVSEQAATNKELLGYLAAPGGYASLIATQDFRDLSDEDPEDVRQGLLTKRGGYWFINKYPGRNGYLAVNNIPVIRLSEVYLIGAEAALKMKNPRQEVADRYLHAIRSRANPAVPAVRASEENILRERRKELVLEGHRFFDAMRLGKKLCRQGGWHFLRPQDLICPSWDDYRIVAPLPQAELDANPALRQSQNEGY